MTDLTTLHEQLAAVTSLGRNLTEVLTDITAIAHRAMTGG